MSGYRAIVVGATGAVGSALVRELLAAPRCQHVTALVRRESDRLAALPGASKLAQKVIDLEQLESTTRSFAHGCQVGFCTLGVGQPRKVSRDELWRVDVEYATAFARGCRAAGVRHLSLLTAVGANARSGIYYLRVKGSVEEALTALGFERLSFFRPSLLVTPELRYGAQDRVTQTLFPLVSWMMPSRYRQIRVETLARAMRADAERASDGIEVLHQAEFKALAR